MEGDEDNVFYLLEGEVNNFRVEIDEMSIHEMKDQMVDLRRFCNLLKDFGFGLEKCPLKIDVDELEKIEKIVN